MRQLFNPESLIWKPLGYLGDLVTLSLLWIVFSIPLLTLGPASAALYDTAVHCLRRKEDTVLTRFFSTFKRELRQGVLSTLIVLAAFALFFGLVRLAIDPTGSPAYVYALLLLLLLFMLACLCWLWSVQSRFTMGLGSLLANSLKLAFGHILRSAAMAVLWAGVIYAGMRFILSLFVCPALAALLSSVMIEPVFRQYEQSAPPLDESRKI